MSVISITPIPQHSGGSSNRFHWTVDTFYRAVGAGVFDEPKRLELVYGDLREKETVNLPHATTTSRTAERIRRLFQDQFYVREEKPVRLGNDTEPLPDIAVVQGVNKDYEARHPDADDIALLIEVANTTADYVTGEKARMYARSGISDYWVILINRRELIVFRDSTLEGYASRSQLSEADTVTPLAASTVITSVRDLLPRVSPTSSVQEG